VAPTIFGSTVGYPSDSLASCIYDVQSQSVAIGPMPCRKLHCNSITWSPTPTSPIC